MGMGTDKWHANELSPPSPLYPRLIAVLIELQPLATKDANGEKLSERAPRSGPRPYPPVHGDGSRGPGNGDAPRENWLAPAWLQPVTRRSTICAPTRSSSVWMARMAMRRSSLRCS